MSIEIRIYLNKSFIFNIFQKAGPSTPRITEVPEGVGGGGFPDAFVPIYQRRFEASVQSADLGVQAEHGDNSAQVQVVAIVLESEAVPMLHLGDELGPAVDQSSTPGANDMLGVAVVPQVGGHFIVSHKVCGPGARN